MKGRQLRAKRLAADLRQHDLAKAIGVHWTTISRMERDRLAISKATEIAVNHILTQEARKK